jgi:hypothetical protein
VPGVFTPGAEGPRAATVHIYITGPDGQTVSQLNLSGLGIGIPSLTMSIPLDTTMEAMILEDIIMPIYSGVTSNGPITAVEFTLGMNTDLLTPVELLLEGTALEGGRVAEFSVSKFDSVFVRVEFTPGRILNAGILARLRFQTFVADTLHTFITPLRFSVEAGGNKCVTTSITSAERRALFTLIPQCGDQTLSDHLNGKIPGMSILAVHPNPTRGAVKLDVRAASDLTEALVEIFDMQGSLVMSSTLPVVRHKGKASMNLSMPASSGTYYVRVRTEHFVSTRQIVVRR